MKPIEKKTRQIFHKIHVEQAKDEPTFKRLVDLLSPRYLKVPDDFFWAKLVWTQDVALTLMQHTACSAPAPQR